MSDDEQLLDDAAEEDEPEEEAELPVGRAVEDSSEEEEDEGADAYDIDDGFLVNEQDDEEPEESDDEERRRKERKKKRKRERELVLEDEDYELLAENQVVGIRRPQNERRRIRKKGSDGGGARTAEDMKQELFGLEEEGIEDELDEPIDHLERDYDEPIDDDEDDFIDDDLDMDGNRTRRKKRLSGIPEGVSGQALAEAQAIFGDVSEMLRKYQESKATRTGEIDDINDINEYDLSDEEMAEQIREQKEEKRQQRMLRKAQEQIDPEMMRKHHLLPEDQLIRDTDLPEREQLLRTFELEGVDQDACAAWVYERVFGDKAPRRFERSLVEQGCREVEGTPPDGRDYWNRGELEGDITDLGSRRGVTRSRKPDDIDRWLKDEDEQRRLRNAIKDVLKHMWDKHEELPLVAMYRKEICGELLACREKDLPITTTKRQEDSREKKREPDFQQGTVQAYGRRMRRWEVLWLVHSQSVKWRLLQKRKHTRRKIYEEALHHANTDEQRDAFSACMEALDAADSMEMVDDVDHKFRLADQMSGDGGVSSLAISGGHRRRQKTSTYSLCRKAGIHNFVNSLGLTPQEFGENLEYKYKRHEPEDLKESAEDVAKQHLTPIGGFDNVESLLRGARHMAAAELAAEPGVRQAVREMYYASAVVSTDPTPEGEAKLDPFHPCAVAKRLRNKPVSRFDDSDQYLKIHLAEKEGLIKVSLKVPDGEGDNNVLERDLMSVLRENYLSNSVSAVSQSWNNLRLEVLQDTLMNILIPSLERELKQKLLNDAKDAVARQASEQLWKYAVQPPLKLVNPDDDVDVTDFHIMACCWGPGRPGPPTTLVCMDNKGNLIDMLHCPQFSGEIRRAVKKGETYNIFEDQRKKTDAERIREFINIHQPHVAVVGASSMDCKKLKDDVDTIRDWILEYTPGVFTKMETRGCDIRFADDSVAQLWENSAAAREEFADQLPIVRRGIALGRFLLDPLAVLCSLCGSSEEVLAMNLHPLQKGLTDDDRMGVVSKVLITAVNQVGVDVNDMSKIPWRAPPLQYVCGLGPRKASALLKAIQRQPSRCVESREALWRELGVIGKLVFKNCAAFIRVSSSSGSYDQAIDELDMTRIHPLFYKEARTLASLAIRGSSSREKDPVYAVLKPKHRIDVENLDLVAFNLHLAEENPSKANLLATLIDIQMEFISQFGDFREDPGPPKEDEVFWMVSGESEQSLKEGKRVEAVVRFVTAEFIVCTLNDGSNLEAILDKQDISGSGTIQDCRDLVANNVRLQTGDTLQARIKKVDPKNFQVLITTKSSVLGNERYYEERYCRDVERFYHVITEDERRKNELEQKRSQKGKGFIQRNIRHPYFKNISMAEATEVLKHDPNLECLFRPSSKGIHQISLSLKLFRPTSNEYGWQFQHFEVKEGPKTGGPSQQLGLSTPLQIDLSAYASGNKRPEKYEDLDEVVARFVEPYLEKVRKMQTHRKWSDRRFSEMQECLAKEKQGSKHVVYNIGYYYEKPGIFYIAYMPNNTAHKQCFSVTPDGYYFRGKMWKTVDHLLTEWKARPEKMSEDQGKGAPAAAAGARHAAPQARQQQPYGQPAAQYSQRGAYAPAAYPPAPQSAYQANWAYPGVGQG